LKGEKPIRVHVRIVWRCSLYGAVGSRAKINNGVIVKEYLMKIRSGVTYRKLKGLRDSWQKRAAELPIGDERITLLKCAKELDDMIFTTIVRSAFEGLI
jgi:hypothetical protein